MMQEFLPRLLTDLRWRVRNGSWRRMRRVTDCVSASQRACLLSTAQRAARGTIERTERLLARHTPSQSGLGRRGSAATRVTEGTRRVFHGPKSRIQLGLEPNVSIDILLLARSPLADTALGVHAHHGVAVRVEALSPFPFSL